MRPLSLLTFLCLLFPCFAAERRALEFRDIIELNEPSEPRISPDGSRVVFTLSRASLESNAIRRSFWVVEGKQPRKLLDEAPLGAPQWEPDGASLIVRLARKGNVAFWRLPTGGGAPTPVFEHENPVLSAWWSPDRSQVLFLAADPIPPEESRRPQREGVLYDETFHGIRSFTRNSWVKPPNPGLWLWRKGMRHAEPVPDLPVPGEVAWSPDGLQAAFEAGGRIGILRGTAFEPLITSSLSIRGLRWLDSRTLVYAVTGDVERYYVPRSVIRTLDTQTKREADLPGNGPWFFLSRLQSAGADGILVEYDDWSRSTLYRVPRVGGPAAAVYTGPRHLSGCHFSRDSRRAACIAQSSMEPPEIAVLDIETGKLDIATHLNPEFDRIRLQPALERHWRNHYGNQSNGFLILPPGFVKGRPVPLVMIHYAFSNRFNAQAQWMTAYPVQHLAAAGIAVLLHNYPRELGWKRGDFKGAALSQAYNPLASMKAAVEELAAEGIIDPKRTGIAGWSFGAWLAELAITQTSLFCAASAGEGGLNNAGQYWVTGSAQMQQYLDDFFGGPPFGEAYANYRELAPALNANRVTAPLLREYGSDVGVQSLEFYMALRRLGKPVEQYIYPNAPHVFDSPSHRLASMQRNLDWFRFWLQAYEDPDPRKREQYRRWRALHGSYCGRSPS